MYTVFKLTRWSKTYSFTLRPTGSLSDLQFHSQTYSFTLRSAVSVISQTILKKIVLWLNANFTTSYRKRKFGDTTDAFDLVNTKTPYKTRHITRHKMVKIHTTGKNVDNSYFMGNLVAPNYRSLWLS